MPSGISLIKAGGSSIVYTVISLASPPSVGTRTLGVIVSQARCGQCKPNQCFKCAFGKHLPYCKYCSPFKVLQLTKELDEDVHYIYVRRQHEDRMVVPYNPEIALLGGASHNMQHISKHSFEQYLAKYISKAGNSLVPSPSPHVQERRVWWSERLFLSQLPNQRARIRLQNVIEYEI